MELSTERLKHRRKIIRRGLADFGLAFCAKCDIVAGLLCIEAVFTIPTPGCLYELLTRSTKTILSRLVHCSSFLCEEP